MGMAEVTPLILIIDDDPAFREIFSIKLSASGFRMETADSGEDGIKKAKSLKPDLILLDVKMPGLTGPDTLIKLKEDPETANIRVVFLTSLGDPWTEAQAINKRLSKEFGALGYIKKTEDLDTLVEKVRAFLA